MGRLAEGALRRHRRVTIMALATLALLAWAWLVTGAGMGGVPNWALLPARGPNMAMADMGAMPPAPGPLVFAMWLVMMVAMMLPSAAPTVLLYARAASHGAAPDAPAPASAAFLSGYLLVWSGFAAAAAWAQLQLAAAGLLAMETMGSADRWLSAGAMLAAGLYQLTPLKRACLAHCRSPAEYLARHYRPGARGALRLGVLHGTYCFGCCWALMLLLFVGGVMNLAWIAVLTLLVAAEKLLPGGRIVGLVSGVALIVLSAVILVA